jgi:hypothetical protein
MKLRSGKWIQEKDSSERATHDTELIRCVLERIDNPSDLVSCTKVCQAWRSIALEPYLWIRIYEQYPSDVDVTELMRATLEKNCNCPIPDFLSTEVLHQDCKMRMMKNRLLLLTKESHEFHDANTSACASIAKSISLDDLVFTLDILVDGVPRSSTCFDRAHANTVNKLQIDLLLEEVEVDWNCPESKAFSAITHRGLSLLNTVSEKLKVKISVMRQTDLKMTQIFSYETTCCNNFDWNLSWDTADAGEFLVDWTQDRDNLLDHWTLWLYSSIVGPSTFNSKKLRNSFQITNSSAIFNVDNDCSPAAAEGPSSSQEDSSKDQFLLCDVRLQLNMQRTKKGVNVIIDHAIIMEYFHYWKKGQNTYYVELKDEEFTKALESERAWH